MTPPIAVAERRWKEGYYDEKSETVEIVTFLVFPGGVPVSDKYGERPGEYSASQTRAVVIRPSGQYTTCRVDELWRTT